MRKAILIGFLLAFVFQSNAQEYLFEFGTVRGLDALVASETPLETPIKWFDVNTGKDSWYFEGEELVCKGLPIGVIRSEKQYQNFIMHIEWKHMEAGGNSGTFVWSSAVPGENRLPDGVEVQMLELDWVNQKIGRAHV